MLQGRQLQWPVTPSGNYALQELSGAIAFAHRLHFLADLESY